MSLYNRHSIRLAGYDYTSPSAYFVTLVTHNRISLFGEVIDSAMRPNTHGEIALAQWQRLPSRFPGLIIYEAVVMPNHFHGILQLSETRPDLQKTNAKNVQPGSLGAIIRTYKSSVTQSIRGLLNESIIVWQRNYYEHIIRNEVEMQKIVDYIQTNPLRWSEDRFFIT